MALWSRPVRLVMITAGLLLVLAGVALKAELLGVLDLLDVRGDRLWLTLPGFEAVFPNGIATDEVRSLARRVIIPVAAVSLAALAAGAVRLRGPAREMASRWPRGAQGIAAGGVLTAALMAFLPVPFERTEGVQAAVIFAGFTLFVLGAGSSAFEGVGRFAGRFGTLLSRVPPWVVAGVVVIMAATLTQLLFRGRPHVWDSVSHLFHARILASGQLFIESHPLAEFFEGNTIVNNGRWYAQYPPGHTSMLALGVLLGAPWLVNPLLGGAFVLALAALARACFAGSDGRLPTWLALGSPFFLLMSTEFYSHATAALWVTLALHAYVRFMKGGHGRWIVAAGVYVGLCAISRPLTAVGVAIPIALDAVLDFGSWRVWTRARSVLLGVLACAAVTGSLLAYNMGTAGSPLGFGYGAAQGPGFGVARLSGTASDIEADPRSAEREARAATRNSEEARRRQESGNPMPWWLRVAGRLQRLNEALFALPFPSLLVVLLAFLGPPPGRWAYFLLGVPIGLLAVHAPVLYWEQEFGPRYVYEGIGPLLLLSALGLRQLGTVCSRFGADGDGPASARMLGVIVTGLVIGFGLLWPTRLAFYGGDDWGWALDDAAASAVEAARLENALVFVAEDPIRGDRPYLGVFLRNGIDLEEAEVIYAKDLGAANGRLIAHYPDRTPYRYDGRTLRRLNR